MFRVENDELIIKEPRHEHYTHAMNIKVVVYLIVKIVFSSPVLHCNYPVKMVKKLKLCNIKDASVMQKVVVILLQSIIYAVVFFFIYRVFPNTMLTSLELIPVGIISWYWGNIAGMLVILLDMTATTLIISYCSPTNPEPLLSFQPIMGILIHVCFGLVIGTFSSLTSKLKIENANRKDAQEQLKEYQNRLEEIVHKRTQELQSANDRLRQAEKMEAIGQLAGGIAHDFNNQLTIVLGYCELLSNCLSDNIQLLEYVQKITTSGKRAADLTKQLLAFARKGVYKQQVVDIHNIILDVTSLLIRSIHKNITIETRLDASRPYVWGGSTQLQNAVLNLSLNARDAMEHGGTLLFETADVIVNEEFCRKNNVSLTPGAYISICVKDTGCGMNGEILKHIFEPFFTTKEDGKGTGMGLAAVYGIVKSHKGNIIVQSTPGIGSSFTLFLPQTDKPEVRETKFLKSIKSYRGHSVLIIDDERDVAKTIGEMLGECGFDTTLCYSGTEAVELYQKKWKEYSIAIIDMVMPDMDGRETYKKLKMINPAIKTIISSGFALNRDIETTLKAGSNAFLQKPYSQQELVLQIDKILQKTGCTDVCQELVTRNN
jgi:signal transduction histidine kinase/ActR/RegA family two-component response regulator